jgi:hypothetical protein
MQQKSQWLISDGSTAARVLEVEKHSYVMPIKVPKDVDDKTKQFWDNYNSMQRKLIENGLMETK